MMTVTALGTGCPNCKNTVKLFEAVAQEKRVTLELEKVEEPREIAAYGKMSTPGVVICGAVVHAGGVPSRQKVERWLSAATASR